MLKKYLFHIMANFIATIVISAALHRFIPTYFYISILSLPLSGLIAFGQFRIFFKKESMEGSPSSRVVLSLFIATTSLLSFSFHSTVPLNVDRSFSVWMINQLATSPTENEITQVVKNASQFFSPQGGEISRRVDEQIDLGNIREDNGLISLTSRGKRIWHINKIMAQFFGLNTKYSGAGA